MRGKFLTSILGILMLALAAGFILPDRSVTNFMQACGEYISEAFGY